MIVIMKARASSEQVDNLLTHVKTCGLDTHVSSGSERTIVGLIGDVRKVEVNQISMLDGVERVVRILHPFKLASRDFVAEPSEVNVGPVCINGADCVVIAGPCAVEDSTSLLQIAGMVKRAGAHMLRGGAFKPRTSPYAFQGLGEKGLEALAQARTETSLPVVTEVMTPGDVELVANYADMLQIGARNMQNFPLLMEVGRCKTPVLLKRGMMATIEEWLMAAEYILAAGNSDVVLCERGIRTFETYTRNTLDLSAVPAVKQLTHLPVIVDPSHGTGRWELVEPMAVAAIAAGADGLMIEVHNQPEAASCDGAQSLTCKRFAGLMKAVADIAELKGRRLKEASA